MHYILTQARIKAGLTQEGLSSELGITQSHLSALERGEKKPSSDLLGKWAERLGFKLTLQPMTGELQSVAA